MVAMKGMAPYEKEQQTVFIEDLLCSQHCANIYFV